MENLKIIFDELKKFASEHKEIILKVIKFLAIAIIILLPTIFTFTWFVIHVFLNSTTIFHLSWPVLLAISLLTTFVILFIIAFLVIAFVAKNFSKIGKWTCDFSLASVSVLTAWLSGLFLVTVGFKVLNDYYLPLFMQNVIHFIGILLFLWANMTAVENISQIKSKKWGLSIIIIVSLSLLSTSAIAYFRNDYYDTKTREIIIWVTPSTNKVWRHKPNNLKFDPSTGEEIVRADDKQIKLIRETKYNLNSLFSGKKEPKKQAAWKPVYQKTFVGVGYSGGSEKKYNDGGIWTAKCGRDVLRGDRITVIDSNFEHWYDGGWKKYLKEKKLDVYKIQLGDYLTFRNEKGKKFTVVVERRM